MILFRIIFSVGLLLSGVGFISAQEIRLSFHQLGEEDGLTQSDKYFITTDAKGFVWIGTDNGLLRFDGQSLNKYQYNPADSTSLSGNRITSRCFEDAEGNLWFTNFGKVNCYHRQSNKFSDYALEKDIKDYYAFDFDGKQIGLRIGLGNEGHFYLFDIASKQFEKSIPLPGKECLSIKNETGKITHLLSTALPSTTGLQFLEINSGKVIKANFLSTAKGKKSAFVSPTKGAYIDEENRAWVGLYDAIGEYRLGDSSGILHVARINEINDIGSVHAIQAFDQNRLLIGADNGLYIFDKKQKKITSHFSVSPFSDYAFPLKGVSNMNMDHFGNVWLSGTEQKIAYAYLPKNRFASIDCTLGKSIINISEDSNGNIWCSSVDDGTFVFSPERTLLMHTDRLSNPAFPGGFNPLPAVHFFLNNSNEQWWGNIGNYFFLWNESQKQFALDFAYFMGVANTDADRINYCFALKNGKNIAARGAAIHELALSEAKVDLLPWYELESLQLKTITILFEDHKGRIYINDINGKLAIAHRQKDQLIPIKSIADFGLTYAFQEDTKRDRIWAAGANGLGYFDGQTLDFTVFQDAADILSEEVIYDIVLDKSGDLWLPGNRGVLRLNSDRKSVHRFNSADGLLSSVFNKNASLISSRSGELWLGGKNGINVFDPDEIKLLTNIPSVQLTNVLINDEAYNFTSEASELQDLELNYSENTLSFQFAALDYSEPGANQFYYQMEGLDKEPVANSTRGFTRYANLPAGNYTFKVWATNSDLVLNETPLEFPIRIIPPFYQRWWFYLLMLLLITAIIYSVFQYRLAQILKVERLRTRIASDLHDDVGGILSGLAMQSEILEMTAKDEDKSKLHQLAEMSRSAMSGMRDTVWAIDARKDKFEDLIDRMREHAEETLIPKDINYSLNSHQIDLKLILPADIRQNLYLLFKEAVTNVAKHSNGNEVQIDLKMDKAHFEMRIHDNGKVESKSYRSAGLGLSNMKLRADKLEAELQLDSSAGFEVLITRAPL